MLCEVGMLSVMPKVTKLLRGATLCPDPLCLKEADPSGDSPVPGGTFLETEKDRRSWGCCRSHPFWIARGTLVPGHGGRSLFIVGSCLRRNAACTPEAAAIGSWEGEAWSSRRKDTLHVTPPKALLLTLLV